MKITDKRATPKRLEELQIGDFFQKDNDLWQRGSKFSTKYISCWGLKTYERKTLHCNDSVLPVSVEIILTDYKD